MMWSWFDPVEAKRLAAKQMERIKAKEKFKRRRQIEAINGAWAMIGLTAGLVTEGQTGKSILTQVKLEMLLFTCACVIQMKLHELK
ncbi:hypothetical protein glysoja_032951 [Glycine soja]|uniref:Uncharacterized protein n=1 Tax=Glycine soja TaxID=3848 RepID=A0A0B2RNZ8_GLYSO|nr:hypothetical protein glysoja_032951 [Glycine soja]